MHGLARGAEKMTEAGSSDVRCQMSESSSRKSDSGIHPEITMQIKSAKDLIVYQKAYALAMEIFAISNGFPAEPISDL